METPLEIQQAFCQTSGPAVLATVAAVKGSSPGKPGFKMLVAANGETRGTVGGGALEQEVIKDALELMGSRDPVLKSYGLNEQDTGMWCGGEVTVLLEPSTPAPQLWIFGYGNLGREVIELMGSLPFRPVVLHQEEVKGVESRAIEWASLEPFPEVAATDYVLVLTLDADLEMELIRRLAASPPCYIGVMGSKGKAQKMRKQLSERGVNLDALNLHMPVGLAIGARSPKEIAVSIAAELIKERNA